jgi:hypothetical protein
MQDIERVPSTGEPPRRSLEPRPGRRERRFGDPEESGSRTPGNAHVAGDDAERSGALDVRA